MMDIGTLVGPWQGGTMTPEELSERLMVFALRVMKMAEELPTTLGARNAGRQIVASSSSAASNYRAAQRGRSRAEFASKIGVALEEIDESAFWLELIERGGFVSAKRLADLRTEADELVRIISRIRSTTRRSSR